MKRYKSKFQEAINYEFYSEVAETISRNTKTNQKVATEWLKKNYPITMDVINMMAKYASKKKWGEIATAIIDDKKI